MITLHNLGPAPGNRRRGAPDQPIRPLGDHLYRIEINHLPIATFTHTRSDNLSVFLEKAAQAAREHENQKLTRIASLFPSAS